MRLRNLGFIDFISKFALPRTSLDPLTYSPFLGVSIRLHGCIPPTDAKLKLPAVKVKSAKPSERPYKLADCAGMYLLVHLTGSKYWRLKYRLAGKEKVLALGVYREISLAEARIRRDDARLLVREGRDPGVAKQLLLTMFWDIRATGMPPG